MFWSWRGSIWTWNDWNRLGFDRVITSQRWNRWGEVCSLIFHSYSTILLLVRLSSLLGVRPSFWSIVVHCSHRIAFTVESCILSKGWALYSLPWCRCCAVLFLCCSFSSFQHWYWLYFHSYRIDTVEELQDPYIHQFFKQSGLIQGLRDQDGAHDGS